MSIRFLWPAASLAILLSVAPAAAADPEPFLLSDWLLDLRLSTRALSAGQANGGAVLHAVEMPLSGPSWRFLPWIKGRRTNFGTESLVHLLKDASDAVAQEFPGSVLEIGNMGLQDGGPIGQSKSHQGGRDVDLAFFARDRKGNPASTGRFIGYSASGKGSNGYVLDEERTWFLVKTLVQSQDPQVQWMFVSEGVRKRLLAYADESGEDPGIIERAAAVLHQPTDSSDHADHFHLRIYCSAYDRLVGCVDYGPQRAGAGSQDSLVAEVVADLERRVRGYDGTIRAEALRKLELLYLSPEVERAGQARSLFREYLCDESSDVVEASLSGLRRHAPDSLPEAILGLKCSTTPAAAVVLFSQIDRLRDTRVWTHARRMLRSRACSELDFCSSATCKPRAELCVRALAALGHSTQLSDGPLLMQYFGSDRSDVSQAARTALQTLYATKTPWTRDEARPAGARKTASGKKPKSKAPRLSARDQWAQFVSEWQSQSWPRYFRTLLAVRGYRIGPKLYSRSNVKELLKAVKSGDPLSYSAQVALSTILAVDLPRILPPARALSLFSPDKPGP
jgi:murein endopeptidase